MAKRESPLFKILDPNKGIPVDISSLHTRTQSNLVALEDKLDVEWTQAYKFPVASKQLISKRLREVLVSRNIPGPPYTPSRYTVLVVGRTSNGEVVKYVRRETPSPGAGQTSVYVGNRKVRASDLLESLAGVKVKTDPLEAINLIAERKQKEIEDKLKELMSRYTKELGVRWEKVKGKVVEGKTYHGEPVRMDLNFITVEDKSFAHDKIFEILRYSTIQSLSRPSLEDVVRELEGIKAFNRRQGDLRSGRPSARLGAKGYYEKYLQAMEKPWALYHVTSRENLSSIQKEGLSRSVRGSEQFVGKLKAVTEYLAERGERPTILEIDTSKLRPHLLRELEGREGIFTYSGTIPPEAITELPSLEEFVWRPRREEER